MWIVFSYIWLPFMIVPVYGAFERIPDSLLEASGDLGARDWLTCAACSCRWRCPGIVAGSIFTFSLTLGDFITPLLIGGTNSKFIGNVIYEHRHRQQPALRRGAWRSCRSRSWSSTCGRPRARRLRGAVMETPR